MVKSDPQPDARRGETPAGYLSILEFAHHSNLSEPTVRRLKARGRLPHVQPGGPRTKVLIPADALERLMDQPGHEPGSANNPSHELPPETDPPRRPGPRPHWQRQYEHAQQCN